MAKIFRISVSTLSVLPAIKVRIPENKPSFASILIDRNVIWGSFPNTEVMLLTTPTSSVPTIRNVMAYNPPDFPAHLALITR